MISSSLIIRTFLVAWRSGAGLRPDSNSEEASGGNLRCRHGEFSACFSCCIFAPGLRPYSCLTSCTRTSSIDHPKVLVLPDFPDDICSRGPSPSQARLRSTRHNPPWNPAHLPLWAFWHFVGFLAFWLSGDPAIHVVLCDQNPLARIPTHPLCCLLAARSGAALASPSRWPYALQSRSLLIAYPTSHPCSTSFDCPRRAFAPP